MKHTRVSLLALSALAGGVFVASAATTPDMGTNYTLNAMVTTNPIPVVVEVSGLPMDATTAMTEGNYTDFDTDGSGKIDGIVDLMITNLSSDLSPYTEAFFVGTASGNVSGNAPASKVKLTVKGNGYAQDNLANTQAVAAVNFTFSGTGSTLMSSATTNFSTNIWVLYYNADGSLNYSNLFHPSYYSQIQPGLNQVVFIYNNSDITTNFNSPAGSNTISQVNDVEFFWDSWDFGTPLTTDSNIVSSVTVGTNTYTLYPLAMWMSWSPAGGWSTNWYNFGLDASVLPAFIANYQNANNSVDTNNPNETITTTYTSVIIPDGTDSSYTNDDRALSNSWYEVDGTITGTIKAGKATHKLSAESAFLAGYHTTYALSLGSVTNNGTNITATLVVKAVQYGSSLWGQTISGFDDEVVMVNNKLYANNDWQIAGTGTGSVNAKKQTFSLSEKGTSWSTGGSLKYVGTTTSNLLAGFTALTNISAVVNAAATPAVSTPVTNYANPFWDYAGDYSDPTATNVVGTNIFITDSSWYVYAAPDTKTNTVPNGIRSFTATGKIMGQKIPSTPAVNNDATWQDFLDNF